jgi:hypothetical protein
MTDINRHPDPEIQAEIDRLIRQDEHAMSRSGQDLQRVKAINDQLLRREQQQ